MKKPPCKAKIIFFLIFFISGILIVGCSKKDNPVVPEKKRTKFSEYNYFKVDSLLYCYSSASDTFLIKSDAPEYNVTDPLYQVAWNVNNDSIYIYMYKNLERKYFARGTYFETSDSIYFNVWRYNYIISQPYDILTDSNYNTEGYKKVMLKNDCVSYEGAFLDCLILDYLDTSGAPYTVSVGDSTYQFSNRIQRYFLLGRY